MKIARAQKLKNRLWVQWEGRLYSLPLDLHARAPGSGAEETQELVAPFSCKVLKLHAKAGAKLKKGDPVVVVEAMKMEYAYAAPRDGTIASIPVQEGQIVNAGTAFVTWKEEK